MNLMFEGRWRGPKDLGTATLGTAWTTIGSAEVGGARWAGAYIDLNINAGTNARVRLRGMYGSGGSAYYLPLTTVGTSTVDVEDRFVEFVGDSDQKQLLTWELDGVCPWVKLEGSVGGSGGTGAGTATTIDGAQFITAV